MIKNVVIVGGGTAGWMAASLMYARWQRHGINITLIESASIEAIGVGEGSTPLLKSFFDYLSIEEAEWMPKCNATYKSSIRFSGWSTRHGFDSYSHPFPSELDSRATPAYIYNTRLRRQCMDVHAHPDSFLLGTYLAAENRAPTANYSFPFNMSYGYHFDSVLLGQFLRLRAVGLGVTRIEADVVDVSIASDGGISSVVLQDEANNKTVLEADYFIDCSGFSSLLATKALAVNFINYGENLFNNAAVAIPSAINDPIASQTVSTALTCGWAWKIPLTNRYGNGYVYSKDHCSPEQAEAELRTHLDLHDTSVEARHLHFKLGRLENAWTKNCVAIGLSQGFIEPLEATAIDLIQTAIQDFIDAFETAKFTPSNRDAFNNKLNQQYERVRDYIVMHYATNTRDDTPYWRDCRNHGQFSDQVREIHHCWMSGGDLHAHIKKQKLQVFDSVSWHCLYGGMGVYPDQAQLRAASGAEKYDIAKIESFMSRCAMNYPAHMDALTALS